MDYWLLMTGDEGEPGIDGAIIKREGLAPTGHDPFNGFACTVDDTIDRVSALAVRSSKRNTPSRAWGGSPPVSTPKATSLD